MVNERERTNYSIDKFVSTGDEVEATGPHGPCMSLYQ